jgi:hypothetical protein
MLHSQHLAATWAGVKPRVSLAVATLPCRLRPLLTAPSNPAASPLGRDSPPRPCRGNIARRRQALDTVLGGTALFR